MYRCMFMQANVHGSRSNHSSEVHTASSACMQNFWVAEWNLVPFSSRWIRFRWC